MSTPRWTWDGNTIHLDTSESVSAKNAHLNTRSNKQRKWRPWNQRNEEKGQDFKEQTLRAEIAAEKT